MQHHTRQRRIVVIGSGFSGLCLGIQLKQAGIHTFSILEKADQLGGTWRDNTYPGAACDVPSISYCFSFEQKTDWSRKWSPHDEILAYMQHCARKYGLMPHIRLRTAVERAHFDAEAGVWHIQTSSGETLTADILVSGVGQLNRPYIPDIAGLETFQGEHFHSAQWHHADVLTPDYPIGGKRILFSDDYYPTLERDNVEVVTSGIERVTEDAIVTRDGQQRRLDALILATGFESTAFLAPMQIEGLDGRSLHTEWQDGARAYLGMTVSGFPNFFMMYGPNTNLGHNSIIFMIECQTRYIIDCIQGIYSLNLKSLHLRAKVLEDYNRRIQHELQGSVWAETGKSWYKTEEGTITNNWPGTTLRYWWNTRTALLDIYEQERRRVPMHCSNLFLLILPGTFYAQVSLHEKDPRHWCDRSNRIRINPGTPQKIW